MTAPLPWNSRKTMHVDINPNLEREAKKAARVSRTMPLPRRRIKVEGRSYVAFSAHQLLEIETEEERARPGHPIG